MLLEIVYSSVFYTHGLLSQLKTLMIIVTFQELFYFLVINMKGRELNDAHIDFCRLYSNIVFFFLIKNNMMFVLLHINVV